MQAPTFGIRDSRSIKEQRESLPIYLLKDALVKAIAEHQMVVVIGETGSGALVLKLLDCNLPLSCACSLRCNVAQPCCSTSCAKCNMLHLRALQSTKW